LVPGGAKKACDDLDACTVDACDVSTGDCSHQPIANCCNPVKQWWKFDDEGQGAGWTMQKCAASTQYTSPTNCNTVTPTSPTQGWQVWTQAAPVPNNPGALYYGDPKTKNFAFGANAGTATTPPWTVPGAGAKITFSTYWATEGGTTYDKFYVFLLVDGKVASTVLQKGAGAYSSTGKWYNVSVTLDAYAGKQVSLQFYFNSGDSVSNSGLGVLVDDLKLEAPCVN
jgi:hypothetical protein